MTSSEEWPLDLAKNNQYSYPLCGPTVLAPCIYPMRLSVMVKWQSRNMWNEAKMVSFALELRTTWPSTLTVSRKLEITQVQNIFILWFGNKNDNGLNLFTNRQVLSFFFTLVIGKSRNIRSGDKNEFSTSLSVNGSRPKRADYAFQLNSK